MGDMTTTATASSPSPVMVAARLRPLLATDRPHEMVCAQALPLPFAQQIVLGNKCFQADFSFSMEATQSQVFERAVLPLMDRLLQGYDTSITAYGQTTSGKTYTILGPGVHCAFSETEYGIIPRAARYIFGKMMQGPPKKFKVKVSFVEVHNEMLRDLLVSGQFQQELTLLESDAGYPVITGLQEIDCETISDVFNCLHVGMQSRLLQWNNARQAGRPAQSHCIFTLSLEQQWVTSDGTLEQRLSIARFSDLASSEKIFYRGVGGEILGESIHMDPGLIALGNIVASVSQPLQWTSCNPSGDLYRQSTLTKVLKESFGGRCYSLIVCCISPASLNFDESLMTLQFAERVRNIQNFPVMNALSIRMHEENGLQELLTKESTQTIGASGDRSTADTFGIEFAATQWMKLVDSAEGLFNKLVHNDSLTEKEKDEIDKWLCLKQECEECVGSEEGASVAGNDGRLLEKIDEVTENEEKTDSSKEGNYNTVLGEDKSESETESESDSQRPDFEDKLEEYIKEFKTRTDDTVKEHKDDFQQNGIAVDSDKESENEISTQHSMQNRFPSNGRRRSIHPGTQIPLMSLPIDHQAQQTLPPLASEVQHAEGDEDIENRPLENQDENGNLEAPTEEEENMNVTQESIEPQQELKLLTEGKEAKQNEMKIVQTDLKYAHQEIQNLQATIQEKEQFIQEMIKNSDTRACAKQRIQKEKTQLEIKYHNTRKWLAQAEAALSKTKSPCEEKGKYKKEVEKYKKLAIELEKRLKDMEMAMKQIAEGSAKKVLELERSLQKSVNKLEKYKQKLEEKEARQHSLEQELFKDQQKLIELQEKCKMQASKLEEHERNESAAGSGEERMRWLQEEEERQVNIRESSQRFQEQLLQQQSILDKREAFLKEKICLERQRARSIMEVSARISHLDQVLKEKSTDLENIQNEDEKEALRLEIHNLRSTRDCLIEQRCTLGNKFQKDQTLTTLEERKLILCDEAIEAIDATIEYKNELICGRTGGLEEGGREKSEEMLMARLNKLSPMEMRMLLYKYFHKVIDLRESGRKLEVQLTEKELQADTQTWQIKALTSALQQHQMEAERQMVILQRQHQAKLHLVLRTFAEESRSGGGASASSGTEAVAYQQKHQPERAAELNQHKREPHKLRRLLDLDSTMRKRHTGRVGTSESQIENQHKGLRSRSISPEPIPKQNLKQLKAAATSLATKVTRQKNKLIIQQEKPPQNRSKQANN